MVLSSCRAVKQKMYKSKGERTIAAFLDRLNIDYTYQPAVLINDGEYQRIWYPDFGLPKYSIFIEYFGMENDPGYDARTRHKMQAYQQAKLDVIPVYPEHLKGDYERYIMQEILRTMSHRLSDLEEKIGAFPIRHSIEYRHTGRSYAMPADVTVGQIAAGNYLHKELHSVPNHPWFR